MGVKLFTPLRRPKLAHSHFAPESIGKALTQVLRAARPLNTRLLSVLNGPFTPWILPTFYSSTHTTHTLVHALLGKLLDAAFFLVLFVRLNGVNWSPWNEPKRINIYRLASRESPNACNSCQRWNLFAWKLLRKENSPRRRLLTKGARAYIFK